MEHTINKITGGNNNIDSLLADNEHVASLKALVETGNLKSTILFIAHLNIIDLGAVPLLCGFSITSTANREKFITAIFPQVRKACSRQRIPADEH